MNYVNKKKFVTENKSVKSSYEWTIKNFFLINKANGEAIDSPLFTIDENDKIKWFIQVFPKGYKEDSKDFVSVFLYPESEDNNHLIKFEFSIINKNQIKENKFSTSHLFKGKKNGLGFPNFISIKTLENNKETFLPENTLTICCDIEVGVNSRTFEVNTDHQSQYFNQESKEQIELLKDVGNMLEKLELTDAVLITNSGELKAHKAILATRSPVFLAMFTNYMTEKLEGEIKIIDFDSEVVSEMLAFMYTGKIKNIEKNGVDLLHIAEKYQILGLKNLCENFLLSTMSIENASDLLIIAEQCNSEDFKAKVIKFILSHKKEIISTPKFIDLKANHPNLIIDIFFADC